MLDTTAKINMFILYFDSVDVEDLIRLTKGCESYLGGVQLLIMHGHGRQADPHNFHLVYMHVIVVCITNTAGRKCIFKNKRRQNLSSYYKKE